MKWRPSGNDWIFHWRSDYEIAPHFPATNTIVLFFYFPYFPIFFLNFRSSSVVDGKTDVLSDILTGRKKCEVVGMVDYYLAYELFVDMCGINYR